MSEEQNNAPEVTEQELNEQRKIKREKLEQLRSDGRDPFKIAKWDVDAYSADIKSAYPEDL